jgi:hypothetical protein
MLLLCNVNFDLKLVEALSDYLLEAIFILDWYLNRSAEDVGILAECDKLLLQSGNLFLVSLNFDELLAVLLALLFLRQKFDSIFIDY